MDNFFPEQKVITIKNSDFNLETDEKVTIKNKMLCLVLFHDNSHISKEIAKIWQKLSNNIPGIVFYACNLIDNKDIAQVFLTLAIDETSPYKDFARNRIPFILVYRNGKPQKSYHDVVSEPRLINFCTKLLTGDIQQKSSLAIKEDHSEYDSDTLDDETLPHKIEESDNK